jgi:hypothetical protein
VIPSGAFTVALEFDQDNAGDPFAASVVHDGNGCQRVRTWCSRFREDGRAQCALGVTGDWVIYVKYRSLKVTASASPASVTFSNVPGNQTTCNHVEHQQHRLATR